MLACMALLELRTGMYGLQMSHMQHDGHQYLILLKQIEGVPE